MRITTHQMGGSADALRVARESGVRAVKITEYFTDAEFYKAAIPGVQIIGRTYYGPDWGADQSVDPVADADAVFAHLLPVARRNPLIDYWEFVNEPVIARPDQMDKFLVFAMRFLDHCEANGIKAVVGNFPMGTPALPDHDRLEVLRRFTPGLRRIIERGHILGVHEYVCPDMYPEDNGAWVRWLQHRYRWWLDLCDEQGLDKRKLRIFVGECGVDNFSATVNGRLYQTKPWKAMWGDGQDDALKYLEVMARYEMGLRQDPQVVGAALFTFGTGASDLWKNYNVDNTPYPDTWLTWARSNPEMTVPPPPPSNALGVDVSRWQGVMDYRKTVAAGAEFAIAKMSEGLSVDPLWEQNSIEIIRAGLLLGAYHFFRPELDAIAQADHFIKNYPIRGTHLPPALDLEIAPHNSAEYRAGVVAWLNRVRDALGPAPMIYTNRSFYNTWLQGLGLPKEFLLWIASYTNASAPLMPNEFSTWEFWQYTNKGNGAKYGASASAAIDLNLFNGTAAQLRARYPALVRPPTGIPPELERGRYSVTADTLNVRAQPMTRPDLYKPPVVRTLALNALVDVYDSVEIPGASAAWALIHPAGNEWVSATYLKKM